MPETDEQDEPTPWSARAKNKTEYERPNAKTETKQGKIPFELSPRKKKENQSDNVYILSVDMNIIMKPQNIGML